ncbi:MAG TPA: low molecular weight protein tyrosine phosphatase family protein [Chthoniobacteraceae bacterium]|nr:low molecular weight protein tyrosine phosphatase family protein [Chthoniobacteraceae bacterium]
MNKHILFLCSRNRLRSPTAEAVFASHPGIEVDSAGLSDDAVVPVSSEQIVWADLIVVMERRHRQRLNRKFRSVLRGKRVAVLNIPDDYDYMDPALIRLLKARCLVQSIIPTPRGSIKCSTNGRHFC